MKNRNLINRPGSINPDPFFSIIIPTLNEEKFLPRLLKNLVSQTKSNFEVIHVDGHSEDKTCKLALEIGKNLPSFKQIISPIRHVSHQRNLGAKTASGEYLIFIDADTQLPPYFLEGLSYQLHKKPSDTFTTWSIPDSNKPADKTVVTITNLSLELSRLFESPVAIGVLMGCNQKAFKKIGGFREDVQFGEDEDFVKIGHQKGLNFMVYRQPKFIYSLRRFRKEGTLPSLQQIAIKKLNALTGKKIIKTKDYKMGGHIFEQDNTNQSIFHIFDRAIAKSKHQPKIKKFLTDLLTFEELDK